MNRILLFLMLYIINTSFVTAQSPERLLIDKSINHYSLGNYDSTRMVLQKLVEQGYQSFELYYNLGNTYYKLNQLEEAILHYEKAKKIKPDDDDLQYNLELANARITDHIPTLPRSMFVENVIGSINTDYWAMISVGAFSLFIIALLSFLFISEGAAKSLSLISFSILGIVTLLAFVFASISKKAFDDKQEYIVFESSLNVSSAPNTTGKQLFVIHKGLKVEWLQESGEYVKIKLPDGNVGWVIKNSLKEI